MPKITCPNITEDGREFFFSMIKNISELWNFFPEPLNCFSVYSSHIFVWNYLMVKMRFECPTCCIESIVGLSAFRSHALTAQPSVQLKVHRLPIT